MLRQYKYRYFPSTEEEVQENAAFRDMAVNNYDSMMDALSQCHNLFEAEEKKLSEQGKQVWQSVIAAILKANHKT